MRLSSPLDALASSLHHAALVALPYIEYRSRDFEATAGWSFKQVKEAMASNSLPEKDEKRRPEVMECEVVAMFPQTWGSTALGFGGMGGAAMTPAYTVVVRGPGGDLAVYWAGQFAYLVQPRLQTTEQRGLFENDLKNNHTESRANAYLYGVELPTAKKK